MNEEMLIKLLEVNIIKDVPIIYVVKVFIALEDLMNDSDSKGTEQE